jgi:hypothetical protein
MKPSTVVAELLLLAVIACIGAACSSSPLRPRDLQSESPVADVPGSAFRGHAMPGHPASSIPPGPFVVDSSKPASELFDESMAIMSRDMTSAPMTGDSDRDFATMMIPHHQGAIDMAKVELLYGRDPVLRRLAQEIIVTQQSEIALMRRQLDVLRQSAGSRSERRAH